MSYQDKRFQEEVYNQFVQACDAHQNGDYETAETIYRMLVSRKLESWYLHYNFGLLLYETQRFQEALEHYLTAVSITTTNGDVYYNLGLCQKRCGQLEPAISSYQKALSIQENDHECRFNLANCYLANEEIELAIHHYKLVLTDDPYHLSALNNIAYSYHKSGLKQEAMHYYQQVLELNPGHESAEHMLASLTGANRSSVPVSYIKSVFNDYSDSYEHSLVERLDYTLPTQLLAFIQTTSGKSRFNATLDLGCGTGLAGVVLRDVSRKLIGIDLSEKMIAIARQKDIYDELITNDLLVAITTSLDGGFDLFVAADVFTYIGELTPIFEALHGIGDKDCRFYFSVESRGDSPKGFRLQESGRFSHSEDYITELAQTTGWSITEVLPVKLRKERGKWVHGELYALTRTLHE